MAPSYGDEAWTLLFYNGASRSLGDKVLKIDATDTFVSCSTGAAATIRKLKWFVGRFPSLSISRFLLMQPVVLIFCIQTPKELAELVHLQANYAGKSGPTASASLHQVISFIAPVVMLFWLFLPGCYWCASCLDFLHTKFLI